MSKKDFSEKDLNRKYACVFFTRNNKRMLLNYFHNFTTAFAYAESYEHFKIDGELSIEVMPLKKLLKEVCQ